MILTKKWNFRIDAVKQYLGEAISVISQDTQANEFIISCLYNGFPLDLSDLAYAAVTFTKADASTVISTADVQDTLHGRINVLVDYQAITSIGICTVSVKLYFNGGTIVTLMPFPINVIVDPFGGTNESVESTSEYPILTNLIQTVTELGDLQPVYDAIDVVNDRVSNIIAQSGTSDTEVVDMRYSTQEGAFTTAGARVQSIEDKTVMHNNDLYNDAFNHVLLTESNQSEYVEDSYTGFADLEMDGLSIIQGTINGDLVNGTTGLTSSAATLSVTSRILTITGNGAFPTAYGKIPTSIRPKNGNKYFVKATVKIKNSLAVSMTLSLDTVQSAIADVVSVASPVLDEVHTMYGIITWNSNYENQELRVCLSHRYADAATQNGKSMEVNGYESVFLIPMTGTPYEAYDAEQMNALTMRYPIGLESVNYVEMNCKDNSDNLQSTLVINFNEPQSFELSKIIGTARNSFEIRDCALKAYKRLNRHTLLSAQITAITTGTNVQYVTIPLSNFEGLMPQETLVIDNDFMISNAFLEHAGPIDTVGNANKFVTDDTNLYMAFSLGSFADLTAARTYLTTTYPVTLIYRLEETVEIEQSNFDADGIVVTGLLDSCHFGTEFSVSGYNIFPTIDVKYPITIISSLITIKNQTKEASWQTTPM